MKVVADFCSLMKLLVYFLKLFTVSWESLHVNTFDFTSERALSALWLDYSHLIPLSLCSLLLLVNAPLFPLLQLLLCDEMWTRDNDCEDGKSRQSGERPDRESTAKGMGSYEQRQRRGAWQPQASNNHH